MPDPHYRRARALRKCGHVARRARPCWTYVWTGCSGSLALVNESVDSVLGVKLLLSRGFRRNSVLGLNVGLWSVSCRSFLKDQRIWSAPVRPSVACPTFCPNVCRIDNGAKMHFVNAFSLDLIKASGLCKNTIKYPKNIIKYPWCFYSKLFIAVQYFINIMDLYC